MASMSVSAYKMELLSNIYKNPEIVEAIDTRQPEIMAIAKSEPDVLMYNNLFPFIRIPETQSIADTYVMTSVDVARINRNNSTFAVYETRIWVMAHLERMRMPEQYQATRIDYIAEQIDRMFSGKRMFGFTEFDLVSSREILLDVHYMYRELVFQCSDVRLEKSVKR